MTNITPFRGPGKPAPAIAEFPQKPAAPSVAFYEEIAELVSHDGSVALSAWGAGREKLERPRIYLLRSDIIEQLLDRRNVRDFGTLVMAGGTAFPLTATVQS